MPSFKRISAIVCAFALLLCLSACKKDKAVYLSDVDSEVTQSQSETNTDGVSSDASSEETQGEDAIDDSAFDNPDITIDFGTGSVTSTTKNPSSSSKPQSSSNPQSSSKPQSSSQVTSAATQSDEDKENMDGWSPWS